MPWPRSCATSSSPRNLGLVSGADGTIRLFPGLVRIPDVAFASWDRFPGRKIPKEPIPSLAPDLVVEVLSESNTPAEMERKRGEYFASGVRLSGSSIPERGPSTVYTPDGTVDRARRLADGSTEATSCLASRWSSSELFAELDQQG